MTSTPPNSPSVQPPETPSPEAGAPEAEPPKADTKMATAKPKSRLWKWLKRLAITALALMLLAVISVVLVIRHYEAGLPSAEELLHYNPPQVTRVLARDETTVLGEIFTERRTLVPIQQIPDEAKLSVLAAEDAGFYEHAGLSYFGMLRALLVNVRSMRMKQGAGTITQQVGRNVLLSQEKTFERKLREMLLAKKIEQELSKDQILELYLNHIYFGHGRYGIEEASRFYFGKSVRKISLAEAAMLAGIIKGPNLYSPRVDMERAKERQKFVLKQMEAKGFARPDQVEAALAEPIVLAPEPELLAELAPEAVTEARRLLREQVGDEADRGGYTIVTTIDPEAQAAARAAVRKTLDDYAVRHKTVAPLVKGKKEPAAFEGTPTTKGVYEGVVIGADDATHLLKVRVGTVTGSVDLRTASRYNPKNLPPSQFAELGKTVRVSLLEPPSDPMGNGPGDVEEEALSPPPKPPTKMRLELGPQGALVAVDVRSREIVALVGSYEAVRAGLDRTKAHRQPGSTFKAMVYSYGFHTRALTAATVLETDPSKLKSEKYRPDNYEEGEGKTPMRLREAMAHSVNVAAVSALERMSPAGVVGWARSLGVASKLGADLSLALGAYEVTPREMVGAYATFAAGGVYEAPLLVKKVTGPRGQVIELGGRGASQRVMEEAESYVMTSVLTSVVKEGTGKKALVLGRPIAGKTGTTNLSRDAWFVGFSTDVACAVWTGFDDNGPLGAGETGAVAALPAFVEFMREVHRKRPVVDFPVPAGVVRVVIDPVSGLRAREDQEDGLEEVFVAGSEPREVAPAPEEVDGGVAGDAGGGSEEAADAGAAVPAGSAEAPSGRVAPPGDAPPF